MERHYTNGTEPDVLPHYSRCTGPCDQGRKLCPTPEACCLASDTEAEGSTRAFTRPLFLAIALVALAVIVVLAIELPRLTP
jgi:hypothetical protein